MFQGGLSLLRCAHKPGAQASANRTASKARRPPRRRDIPACTHLIGAPRKRTLDGEWMLEDEESASQHYFIPAESQKKKA
jgi:hypothetical protein